MSGWFCGRTGMGREDRMRSQINGIILRIYYNSLALGKHESRRAGRPNYGVRRLDAVLDCVGSGLVRQGW